MQVDVIDPQPGVTVREDGRTISGQVSQRAWLHSPGTKHTRIPPLPAHTSRDSNNATSEKGGGGGVHMQPMTTGVAGDMYHRTLNVS